MSGRKSGIGLPLSAYFRATSLAVEVGHRTKVTVGKASGGKAAVLKSVYIWQPCHPINRDLNEGEVRNCPAGQRRDLNLAASPSSR